MKRLERILINTILLFLLFSIVEINVSAEEYDNSMTDNSFSGTVYLDTSLKGNVSFHYPLCNVNEYEISIGFLSKHVTDHDYSDIGEGWYFELPHLDLKSNSISLHEKGKVYNIQFDNTNSYDVTNYPCKNSFIYDLKNSIYTLETTYYSYVFSDSGLLLYIKDSENKNICCLSYVKGVLDRIDFFEYGCIQIHREADEILIYKSMDNENTTISKFSILRNNGKSFLSKIDSSFGESIRTSENPTGEIISFKYANSANSSYLLVEYDIKNDCCVVLKYNNSSDNNSIREKKTTYNDGTCGVRKYYYDNYFIGMIKIDDDWKETYEYIKTGDDYSIKKTVEFDGNKVQYIDTYNVSGQLIYSSMPEGEVWFYYDEDGKEIKEITDDFTIEFVYDVNGKVIDTVAFSKVVINDDSSSSLPAVNTTLQAAGNRSTSFSVLYNIDSQVGVTNYDVAYNAPYDNYNCYAFALNILNNNYNPGDLSGSTVAAFSSSTMCNLVSIAVRMKLDLENTDHSYISSNVSQSVTGNKWKIVFKVKPGIDYHFMRRISSSWYFKSGQGLHHSVMKVLTYKTPEQISWNQYAYNSSTQQEYVYRSNYYTSSSSYWLINKN